MRRTLTRELPSAKAIRAMLGAAPVQSDKPPALERRAADRDSMPHEYARVVALSRVKGGRVAHVSQVVGDLVLRGEENHVKSHFCVAKLEKFSGLAGADGHRTVS